MNRKIVLTVGLLVIVLGGGALGLGPHPPPTALDGIKLTEGWLGYRYLRQVFELRPDKGCNKFEIVNVASVRFEEDAPGSLDIVIPYGSEEISLQEEPTTFFSSDRAANLSGIKQTSETTTVTVDLLRPFGDGETLVLYLGYTVKDLPGEDGIARPRRSLLDLILGMKPRDFIVTYRPAIFDAHVHVDELFVNIHHRHHIARDSESLAGGKGPKGIEISSSSPYLPMYPSLFSIPAHWFFTEGIPRQPAFRVILKGRPPLYGLHKKLRVLNDDPIFISVLLIIYTALVLCVFTYALRQRQSRQGRIGRTRC